jgi:aryl-alcohol dehydrogenase-like predicted oxidoreductase
MIYRTLGSTGEKVSAIGVGGWHLGLKKVDEQLAIRIVRSAIDRGINFLDNCWDYNDGASELRMGKALRDGYRDHSFVMTKIDGRSKREAARQLDESLRRLRVDYIDLVQHHEIIRFDDPHRIFHAEGANAALVEARAAGKIRYIGFTGHKDPHIHLYMLEVAKENAFKFDTVQMPLNVMDAHYRSFEKRVLPECLHYALNLPSSVVITGIDSMAILDQAFAAVESFHPLSNDEREALLAKTRETAANGHFEPFKTSSIFDSTAENPQWLGEEPPEIRELMPA